MKTLTKTAIAIAAAAASLTVAGAAQAKSWGYGYEAKPAYEKSYAYEHEKKWPVLKKVVKGNKVYICEYLSKYDYSCEFSHYIKSYKSKSWGYGSKY